MWVKERRLKIELISESEEEEEEEEANRVYYIFNIFLHKTKFHVVSCYIYQVFNLTLAKNSNINMNQTWKKNVFIWKKKDIWIKKKKSQVLSITIEI